MGPKVRLSGAVMYVTVSDLNSHVTKAWIGKGEESGYEIKFRKEVRDWSMKFRAPPESNRAVETTLAV
jgi:hypothetical protein